MKFIVTLFPDEDGVFIAECPSIQVLKNIEVTRFAHEKFSPKNHEIRHG